MFIKLINTLVLLFFTIVPFFFLYHYRKIDDALNQVFPRISLKTTDLLVPYLLISIWKLSSMAFYFSFHYFYMLLIILYGIGLASYYAFYKKELILSRFFRVWWRSLFLVSLPTHLILSIVALFRYLF